HREAPLSWFHRLGETGVNGALRCVGLPEGAATVAADLGRLLSIQGSRALDAGHGVRIALRDGDGTTVEVRLPFSLSELGTIRGRVTAPAGFPHHLLRVAVGLHGVTPDAAGGFELPWIPSGASVLRATASSLRPHQRVVEVEAGKATEVTVALGFAETGSLELRGTVVGPQGEPLPGAGVLLFARHRPGRATSRSILADEHGRFVFETLPDELASVEIRLSANLRGYRSTQKVLPTGPVTGEVELRLPQRLVRVTIVARDASDSEPLTRCRFVARRTGAGRLSVQFTRRALDGRYEVWLDPGEHEFVVEAPDYTTHRATVDVGQAGGEFTYEASLVPDRPTGPEVRLVVVLTAEDTAGPVERAKVEVLREHGVEPRVSIDGHRAGGEFVLPVPASTWILRVTAAGFETSEETIRLDPGKKSHRIEIALRRK
ncbi:MAG: carboxypeptidase-like regulatory domain-containing protein, partial [Planctomycetota bacterium]